MIKRGVMIHLTIYTLVHMLVAAIGMASVSKMVRYHEASISYYMLYFILAYALQPFWGYIIDKCFNPIYLSCIGTVLVVIGAFNPSDVAGLFLIGLGNGIFLVGGSIVTQRISKKKGSSLGVFMCPGLLGIYIGYLVGQLEGEPVDLLALMVLVLTVLIIFIKRFVSFLPEQTYRGTRKNIHRIIALMIMLCASGYLGASYSYILKEDILSALIISLAVALGFFAGGILSGILGIFKVGILSIILTIVFQGLSNYFSVFKIACFFCIALLIPIVIGLLTRFVRGLSGFAFGLAALSIFIGYNLNVLLKSNTVLIPVLCLIQVILIFVVFSRKSREI